MIRLPNFCWGINKSAEVYATMRHDMMPREIWKRSNFPERINHTTKEARKVIRNGAGDFLFLFDMDMYSFIWVCPSGFGFALF